MSSSTRSGTSMTANSDKVKVKNAEMTMENLMLPILGIFCSAVVLFVATINNSGEMRKSMKGYANSVALISMILSFALLVKIKMIEHVSVHIRYFQFVWSFVGGCILTFGSGPFSRTGNGYFCLWAMVIFSFLSLGINLESVKDAVRENANPLVGLGFCSFLVIMSTLAYLNTEYQWESTFALLVSLSTILFVAHALIKFQKNATLPNEAFKVLVVLSTLWIFVAGVTTFRGPFIVTGNGYFSSWSGAILSVIACREAHQDDGIEVSDIENPPLPVLSSPSFASDA